MSELHRLFKLALATFVMIAITLPASSQRTMAEELNVVYKPSSKDPDETAILIFSEINQKAAADFGRILAEHRRAYPKHFVHIYLDSPGGDIYAAMIIGRHIRGDPNHAVYVNKDARCFSACIFVLAGGTQRFMDGRIGIHRPYSVLPSNNYSENQKWYSRVATDAKSYFRDMNISEKLYDDMVTIEPESIRVLRTSQLDQYGLTFQDPVFSEMMAAIFMKKYKITRGEYLRRKSVADKFCTDTDCTNRVFSIGR